MKKAALFVILTGMVLAASTSFAATSVASLHGAYSFQLQGVSNQYGYYSGSTWVNLSNGSCPAGHSCFSQALGKITYGTLSFDGKGHATFVSITNINGGGHGPTNGTVWTYSVSGFNGALGSATNGAYLSLGDFNTAGIAQTVLIRTSDSSPEMGVAILQ
jgi:hypothetical protein